MIGIGCAPRYRLSRVHAPADQSCGRL